MEKLLEKRSSERIFRGKESGKESVFWTQGSQRRVDRKTWRPQTQATSRIFLPLLKTRCFSPALKDLVMFYYHFWKNSCHASRISHFFALFGILALVRYLRHTCLTCPFHVFNFNLNSWIYIKHTKSVSTLRRKWFNLFLIWKILNSWSFSRMSMETCQCHLETNKWSVFVDIHSYHFTNEYEGHSQEDFMEWKWLFIHCAAHKFCC